MARNHVVLALVLVAFVGMVAAGQAPSSGPAQSPKSSSQSQAPKADHLESDASSKSPFSSPPSPLSGDSTVPSEPPTTTAIPATASAADRDTSAFELSAVASLI